MLKLEDSQIVEEFNFEHKTTGNLLPNDSLCKFFSMNQNSEFYAFESYHETAFGVRRDDTVNNIEFSHKKCMIYDLSGRIQPQEVDLGENFYSDSPCISLDGKTIAFLTDSLKIVTLVAG